jgi:hypothetical protein
MLCALATVEATLTGDATSVRVVAARNEYVPATAVAVGQPVGMFFLRLEFHQVDDIDHAHL